MALVVKPAEGHRPPSDSERRTVLLTFATVSWQKGSAAQVVSLVQEMRKVRGDLRFRLLSHCPAIDRDPAQCLGIDVVDPGFDPGASRNRRSVALLAKRLKCAAGAIRGQRRARERAKSSDMVAAAYATADLVLDLSGDSYRDAPGGFAPAHHANLLAAFAMGTPYALVSQSLGPFRPWNRPFVRSLLNRASLVYIREKRTREILVRLGVREERLQLAPDLAFALPASSPEPIWAGEAQKPRRPPRPWVGLSISHLGLRLGRRKTGNRYLEGMARLTAHVRAKYQASVLVIPHEISPPYYGADDRTAAEALFVLMGKPAWMQLFRGDYDASALKGLIRECDALIASRMHAAIAGLSSGIPTLVVAWSHKYEGVMEEIGLKEFVWNPDSSGSDELVALFDRLWIQRDSLRSRLLDYAVGARREIAEMAAHIAACLPDSDLRDSLAPPVPRQTEAR